MMILSFAVVDPPEKMSVLHVWWINQLIVINPRENQ